MTDEQIAKLRAKYVELQFGKGYSQGWRGAFQEATWLLKEIAEQKAEIERLQKREAQFAAALYAVKEVVAKDSPQWLLADQLARMMLSQPADEPNVCTCGRQATGDHEPGCTYRPDWL